jgi:hypothetical protein
MDLYHLYNLIKETFTVDWKPDVNSDALRIIDNCGSTTERLYLLGAAYYMGALPVYGTDLRLFFAI